VRIVELDGDLPRECAPVLIAAAEPSHQVAERAGDEEYSCKKRNPCPMLVESSGYRTRVKDAEASVSASAPTKSPRLNRWKSK
jgi:hypothetical protein